MLADVVDLDAHPLGDDGYRARCRDHLQDHGALLLRGFLRPEARRALVAEADRCRHLAYWTEQRHNVYLDPPDPSRPDGDARRHEVVSTKGAITTDQVPGDSGLHVLYDDEVFRSFLCAVLGEEALFPYADPLSSINVNYYDPGQELGWHFDNSSFSVTLLVQMPESGGVFEYHDQLRNADRNDDNEHEVAQVLAGATGRTPIELRQEAGDLALFRGRNALHRVSPVEGDTVRILVVLAYNTEPGLSLSENARLTFFGRLG
ncbi:MAG: 2OG-Fe(II) oxygenase [Actinomycetota bacterium]